MGLSHLGGSMLTGSTRDAPRYQQRPYVPFWARGRETRSSPAGLINLGNTCYLNAVLQSLFALPTFVSAVRTAAASCGTALQRDSVLLALSRCVASRAAATGHHISPGEVKAAVGKRMGAFSGFFQQDAHEFFLALTYGIQEEVLGVEAKRLGRSKIRAGETADATTRAFGFAIQQETTCSACGAVSRIVEQGTHLSLDLPAEGGTTVVPQGVHDMLGAFFREESVDKKCEECGAVDTPHTVSRRIQRLPQVLVLHMKRFQIEMPSGDGEPTCLKIKTRVAIPTTVPLRRYCVDAPTPPLPVMALPGQSGKENEPVNHAEELVAVVPDVDHAQKQQHASVAAAAKRTAGHAFYGPHGAGAAVSSYWDDPTPARKPGSWLRTVSDVFASAKESQDGYDDDLKAAIEASKRSEAARTGADVEEDTALAMAIKRSLEDQEVAAAMAQEGAPVGVHDHEDTKEGGEEDGAPMPEIVEDDAPDTNLGICGNIAVDEAKVGSGSPAAPALPLQYRLSAVVSHHGHRADSGHFTADTRDAVTGQWHRYNDSQVHRIDAAGATNDLRQRECYMLFYTAH